jgi:hypothetical protein
MRQPYYLGFHRTDSGKSVFYVYDDFGNRCTKYMPRAFAIRLLDQLNAKGFKAMEARNYDQNGQLRKEIVALRYAA